MKNTSENIDSSRERPTKSFFDLVEEKYLIRWAAFFLCVMFWLIIWRML
ncbi:hypothetical protein [Phyllobacterium sp. K27]